MFARIAECSELQTEIDDPPSFSHSLVSVSQALGSTMSSLSLLLGQQKRAAALGACPVFTYEVYRAMETRGRGFREKVRCQIETSMPSTWFADEQPTFETIHSWRAILVTLLAELHLQHELPFVWLSLKETAAMSRRSRPVSRAFSGSAFETFYQRESLVQSIGQTLDGTVCTRSSVYEPLRMLYTECLPHALDDKNARALFDSLGVLSGDQITAWSMFFALYTVGVLGSVLDSDMIHMRVGRVLATLRPCLHHIALKGSQSV